jgi:H+-translocating NAD(P) transhydrogenase subunit alpha
MDGMALLTIVVLSAFVGVEVISRVSSVLRTPLMSGANAIHGIVLIGAITVAGAADNESQFWLAIVAVVLASMNLVGGFVATDRMLETSSSRTVPAVTDEGGGR